MNSFFASCEQHDNPGLRGRPVGVCPVLAETGAVIAASAEAKAAGVGMGCRAAEARRRCPGIMLLQARPARYVQIHHQIVKAMQQVVPITKTWSIDEWAIRLVGRERHPETAIDMGRRLKASIAEQLSPALRCSVGLAPSRLLAKTACELQKPDGLVCLTLDDLPMALDGMSPRDIPGIGARMAVRLHRADVHDVHQLWALSEADCRRIWGSVQGAIFWRGLHGLDTPEVPTRRGSMGHAHILPPDKRTDEGAHAIMVRLLCKAAMRLRRDGYLAHALHAHVGFNDGQQWSTSIHLPAVQDTPTILQHFDRLWAQRPTHAFPPHPLRQGGPKSVDVTLGDLRHRSTCTAPLFEQSQRPLQLSKTMDRINRRFGSHAVHPGSMHSVIDYQMDDKIAFGRIPDEDLAM